MSRNIFNLALDFYQSPAEHRDLMDPAAPLPPDIGFLLDALTENKDPRSEQPVALPADLRAAIQFLIERVFFAPGADCYRVLGLNYGARPDEIRKHYNQLLNIFALDQADRSGEWNTTFATQINRAYSVLRDPERRLAYDQNLLQPAGGKGPGGHAREGRAVADAEPAKSPRKVSYLNPGSPPARSLTPEQEIQELQRQLQKGARDSADKAVPGERPAAAPESSPRNSFIANRIDRASGIGEPSEAGLHHRPLSGESAPWSHHAESEGGSHEHFPKGIPVTAPETDAGKGKRIFSMDRASFALMTAVVLVLIVYAIVLPNSFQGGSGPGPEQESELAGDMSAEMTNGNVIREGSVSGLSDIAGTDDRTSLGSDNVFADTGRSVPPSGPAAVAGADKGDASREMPVSNPVYVKPQTDKQQPASVPSADSGRVTSAGVDDKKSQKAPAKSVTTKQDATASAKGDAGSSAGADSVAPSKKLEAMRQSLQAETAIDPIVPAARTPQETTRTTARVSPPVKSAPTPTAAAPSRQVQPSAGTPAGARTGTLASIAPVQPAQNGGGITIQELDRLGETFSRAYEAGDLALLVSLFSEDARTNDQSSRSGIEQDYRDLFQLSESRTFTFGRLRWEQDKNGDGLKGEGDFQAEVQLKGESDVTTVQGKVVFHVRRAPGGIVITEMLHTYN